MLALLCASLLLTAIIVRTTYTQVNNLDQTARILENNLQKKEGYVSSVINDKKLYNTLKQLQQRPQTAIDLIKEFTTEKNIWFVTLNDNRVSFWSGIKVIPEFPAAIKEGPSFIKESNGLYEAIKKSDGNFSVIFFIPVKFNYSFQNEYLQNTFATDLLKDDNIEIADFTDKGVYDIHSSTHNHKYLFSVKLKPGEVNHTFFYYEITIWLLTLLCFCILIHNICNYVTSKGYFIVSLIILATFVVLTRWINLHYNWPEFTYKLDIFSPTLYASSVIYPSLGDLCINIVFITWFVSFLYAKRRYLLKYPPGKTTGYLAFTISLIIVMILSTLLLNIFNGLVMNSKISFDVNNVLNLSLFSLLGVVVLCFSFLIYYLMVEIFLTIAGRLSISNLSKALIIIACMAAATVIVSIYQGFTMFYVFSAILIFARAYAYRYQGGKLNAISLSSIILICALISAIKLNHFEGIKEQNVRKAFIEKLQAPTDASADYTFKRAEQDIVKDPSIIQYFNDSTHNPSFVKTRLQKLYFNGSLPTYFFNVYEFDKDDRPLSDKTYALTVYKDMVTYSSQKVSGYFYKENDSFGIQHYFGMLPIFENGKKIGTIVADLKSKPLQSFASFPDLLVDGRINREEEFKNYSYAFYGDGKLITQSGGYIYDLENTELKGAVKQYLVKTTTSAGQHWYQQFTNYSHLIYKPTERNLIVVSKEQNLLFIAITSVTFFFVVFLVFSVLVLLTGWLWIRIKIFNIKNNRIRWNFKINFGLVLYKTRIQLSLILAVVVTLFAVGFITFFSISSQYQTQQDKTIREKINRIASAFENGTYEKYLSNINEESQVDFNAFANTYAADLTLYNNKGIELINTQPKIYEFGLQARRMNARAFINLSQFQKSEFLNEEVIGRLNYKAAYVPLRNGGNQTIAYLQLPYFSNEVEYKERIGSLLNIMINVYALIFIGIGLFAVIIARQITAPLNFIQFSLSKTIYGKKNEPIRWDRNDEIGALVKEYNKMIAALENSAQKLAQSERESAWREMAKQVAHEIKNPLTPLKLGLQLLDKSWRDKDPKFDQKFERFSKSFVEQIESLSNIASEFSAFAKMPDTRLERLNLFDILTQAVTIFKQMDNVRIEYRAPETPFFIDADRDQLLRCFNNLLKNAIEATPADKLGIIAINNMITHKNILLTIKDNGKGIPEHLREKIFEPNFTTKSSGTGLGLAFVKNSIENAGGKVWFETVEGVGTTFYLSLPAAAV